MKARATLECAHGAHTFGPGEYVPLMGASAQAIVQTCSSCGNVKGEARLETPGGPTPWVRFVARSSAEMQWQALRVIEPMRPADPTNPERYIVRDYATGVSLPGQPSASVVRATRGPNPARYVQAILIHGIWHNADLVVVDTEAACQVDDARSVFADEQYAPC